MNAIQSSTQTQNGFSYSQVYFEQLVDHALSHAQKLGASDAKVDASEGCGLNISVRHGELETVERNRDKSLHVMVYVGQQRGNATTSDFSQQAIEQAVQAAYDIARFTAKDEASGLPDFDDIAKPSEYRELDLFHPWNITSEEAAELAKRCEAAAFKADSRITNSEGASVSAQQTHFFSAHTHGFRGGYATSRHSLSVAPIATSGDDMQRDAWFSSERCAADLEQAESIGQNAAQRALNRLHSRSVPTTQCPVLFESILSAGLLGAFVQAVNGTALYRKSTFLLDSIDKTIFAPHVDIFEDPFILRGKGSSPFDTEGVRVRQRQVVEEGKVRGYFLGSYSARKLGLKTTGNAGGSHNLSLTSRLTQSQDDLAAMLKKLGRGLFVTELMGQGVNYVTGDYSRGASGFWVENGEIAFPVHEITIASNLKDMFLGIQAIGSDIYTYGGKTAGSVLINQMKIAGN